MAGLRIWHILAVVAAVAVFFAALRYESSCTPISHILFWSYLCGGLGLFAARRRGRRWKTGLILGLILGPLGVVIAASKPVPEPHSRG
jgi:hypothetical protein